MLEYFEERGMSWFDCYVHVYDVYDMYDMYDMLRIGRYFCHFYCRHFFPHLCFLSLLPYLYNQKE